MRYTEYLLHSGVPQLPIVEGDFEPTLDEDNDGYLVAVWLKSGDRKLGWKENANDI